VEKIPQFQSVPQEKRPSNAHNSLDDGFNLIPFSQTNIISPSYAGPVIKWVRKLIVFVSVIFVVVLLLNFALSYVVNYQKRWQDRLVSEMSVYDDVGIQAKDIDEKIIAYKNFLGSRKIILDKFKYVLEKKGDHIEIKNLDIDHYGFTMNFSVKDAVSFTKFIAACIEGGMISDVTIQSATMNTEKSVFDVSIHGGFK
jgi:hypothetical protein